MPRTPRGSLVSHFPTFYPRRMRSGAIQGSSGTALNQNLVLFNDAQDGSYLVVWDLSVCVAAPTNMSPTTPIASGGGGLGGGLGGARRPITFVGATSASNAAASTLSLPLPAGVINGDTLISFILGSVDSFTPLAGWNRIANPIDGGNLMDRWSPQMQGGGAFSKVANNEQGPYGWSWPSTAFPAGALLAFRNVDPTVIDTARDTTLQASVTTLTSPALTTTVANDYVVTCFAVTSNPSGTTSFSGAPGDRTQDANIAAVNASNMGIWAGHAALGAAGAVAAESITLSQSSEGAGLQLALKPTSSSPGAGGPGGAPVVGDTGALPGLLLITQGTSNVIGPYIFLTGAGLWRWQHDFPFVAIPPGGTYVVNLTGDCAGWDVSWMWEVVKGI